MTVKNSWPRRQLDRGQMSAPAHTTTGTKGTFAGSRTIQEALPSRTGPSRLFKEIQNYVLVP
jgi:hypothetical protein